MIQLIDMWKTYDLGEHEVHALAGVALTVDDGEFVAIIGSSGSGKSTMMNILANRPQLPGSTILSTASRIDEHQK
jgi:ABC-type lipoprotein export system ATPase subunit